MAKNFVGQVDDIIRKNQAKMTAVARMSTQDLVNIVQTPVAKGGKMRLATGFLRASGQMSLTGVPSGPVRGEKDVKYDDGNGKSATVIASLAGFQLGMSLFFGWTANYAKVRETYDGFLESGLQRWQEIVDKNVAEVKRRFR